MGLFNIGFLDISLWDIIWSNLNIQSFKIDSFNKIKQKYGI